MEIITGVLLGLSTLLFIGPVFFYLLKSTLEHSLKAGLSVAVGVIIGDIIYVVLILKGLGPIFEDETNKKWLALFGGILLLGIGLKYLIKPNIKSESINKLRSSSLWRYMLNGFLINFINPFVIGVLILFLTINQSKFNNDISIVISLVTTLVIIFLTDCLKAIFAQKLKNLINPNMLKSVVYVVGVVMIVFGIQLLLQIA